MARIIRTSLIVSTPRTRRAYDAGVKAAQAGAEYTAAQAKWEARVWAHEEFTADETDAYEAGYTDTPTPEATAMAAAVAADNAAAVETAPTADQVTILEAAAYAEPCTCEAKVTHPHGGGHADTCRALLATHALDAARRAVWRAEHPTTFTPHPVAAEAATPAPEAPAMWNFPGYDDEPRTAESALQEWIDTQELVLDDTETEALYQFTSHAAPAEFNIAAIQQGADYAGIDLTHSPLPTRINGQ